VFVELQKFVGRTRAIAGFLCEAVVGIAFIFGRFTHGGLATTVVWTGVVEDTVGSSGVQLNSIAKNFK